ncbi:MAG: P-loop NTPase fold protein [Candidatus Thiodiazotropha sp. L084R]
MFLPNIKEHLPNNLLIVIDDIERAEHIDVMQLHGFISLLTEELNFRVLLILNSDKLDSSNKQKWEIIHEKLISREVKLTTTASEAVDIGLSGIARTKYAILHKYIDKLNITNIRIIQHIRRVCETITLKRSMNDDVFESLTKSIVLLTAIHLKAVNDWPDIDWLVHNTKHPTLHDDDENSKLWTYKIEKYNLGYLDNFEFEILIPFLRTGHLNNTLLTNYIEKVEYRINSEKTYTSLSELYTKEYWDPNRTSAQILEIIDNLKKI